jgi:uncharacterized membrane protein HdeD (DUF308 family)
LVVAVAGRWIAWIVIALVVLQFDQASLTTVGVLVGLMFLLSGVQQLAIAALVERWKWLGRCSARCSWSPG